MPTSQYEYRPQNNWDQGVVPPLYFAPKSKDNTTFPIKMKRVAPFPLTVFQLL